MKKNTDQHAALAALPPGFNPIANPPGWTRSSDPDRYHQARQPEGAPSLSPDATLDNAYRHALRLLASARTELGICLAVRAGFNSGHADPQHVRALSRILRGSLIAHFRAVDLSLPCAADAEVREYVVGQADEALFLEAEHDRLMDQHTRQPGSVSLMELYALTVRLGSLALDLVEHYWTSDEFEALFSAVETAIGSDCLFLHTRVMPNATDKQDCAVAA